MVIKYLNYACFLISNSHAWKQTNTHMQKTIFNIQPQRKTEENDMNLPSLWEITTWVRNNERNRVNRERDFWIWKVKLMVFFKLFFLPRTWCVGVVGWKMASQYVQFLILEICECVTLYFTRDFADIIKVMDLKTRRLSWIIWVIPI